MKILHVLAQLPARTGSGVYFSNLIEGLQPYGHEQAALFAVQDCFEFELLPPARQYPLEFQSAALPFPIVGMSDIMPYPTLTYGSMDEAQRQTWLAAFEQRLKQARAEFQPDLLILHHLWMLTALAVEIFPDTPKIGVCHNTDIRQAEQQPSLRQRYVGNLQQLDKVFALSAGQGALITATFGIDPRKIVAIGGGFNDRIFYPPPFKKPNSQVQIVFSAKIDPSKGVFELVRAFEQLYRENSNLHLHIVGTPEGAPGQRLLTMIEGHTAITLWPIKKQRVLAEFLRDKDIFVMPSFFEGLGLMALESLASGMWVVSSAIEGLQALLGEPLNHSGVIEYVPLPRIYDTDKPYAEDLAQFVADLAAKLRLQIAKVERGKTIPPALMAEIQKHSWRAMMARIQQEIAFFSR